MEALAITSEPYAVSAGFGVALEGAGLGNEVYVEPVQSRGAQVGQRVVPEGVVSVPVEDAPEAPLTLSRE